jgi:protein-S-isoprenylcysteine O-methyltransferase Ste14
MQSQRRNAIVSALFTLFGGPGIVLFWLPLWLTHFRPVPGEPVWMCAAGVALIVLGLAPGLESVWRFVAVGRGTLVPTSETEHLVVSGFYRYVRNPMYVGVMATLAGELLLFRNRGLWIEATLVLVGLNVFVRLYEEPRLARRFGEEYARFRRHVPRWWPRLHPWDGHDD